MTKRKVGRPSKYKPEYCAHLIRFFDIDRIIYKDITITYKNGDTVDKTVPEASPTPFFGDWCKEIGICQDTMNEWVKTYPEFSEAYKEAKTLQENFFIECALKGVHNSTFTIFTMKNVCGWRDEQHIKAEGMKLIIQIVDYGKRTENTDTDRSLPASRLDVGCPS